MANEGDAERLVVLLEARIRDFERNMAKASGTAGKNYGQMRKDSKTATDRMEADMVRSTTAVNRVLAASSTKIGAVGKTMIAGFAGGLVVGGVAGIVSQVGQLATAVASVGDEAKRAGVSAEAFQELGYVARQNRIGMDALTDGLKELNLRADEFIFTGGGSAAEAFQRMGYTADELKEKLKDPSALFTEIIGKLGQLDQAAQIRIADEIFGGTGGEKFVQLIEQGEEGIRSTIKEARNLGLVMDSDMIDKAADLDRKFQTVSETVGTALKGAIVEAANALANFWNGFNDFITSPERIVAGQGQPFWDQLNADQRNQLRLDVQLSGIRKPEDVYSALGLNPDGTIKVQPPTTPASTSSTSSGSGRSTAASDTDRQAKAVQNLIAGLEFERSTIGLSAVEQAKLNALRQAGAAATEEQQAHISALVDATYAERAAADLTAQSMQQLNDMGVNAAQSLADAFADGKVEVGELLTLVGDLVKQLLSMPGGGGGGTWLSELVGGLFGASGTATGGTWGNGLWGSAIFRRSSGGPVWGPGTSTSDSIPAFLSDGEYVVNAKAAAQHRALLDAINSGRFLQPHTPSGVGEAAGGAPSPLPGSQLNISMAPVTHIHGSGLSPDQLASVLEANNKALLGQVVPTVRHAIRQGAFG